MTDRDLVVVTVPGVQRYIAESRSTADAAAASRIVSGLTGAMVQAVEPPDEVVLPGVGDAGLPNRVVALAEAGTGAALAQRLAARVQDAWSTQVARVWPGGQAPAGVPAAPGFPSVRWVVVEASVGDYATQWDRAQKALAARKRTGVFDRYDDPTVSRLCALTGRWAAVDDSIPVRPAVRRRRGEALSVPALVKRAHGGPGFASTWSVATGPFRHALIAGLPDDPDLSNAVDKLRGEITAMEAHGVRFGTGRLPGLTASPDPAQTKGPAAWLVDVEGACLLPENWAVDSVRRDHSLVEPPDTSSREQFQQACDRCMGAAAKLLSLAAAREIPTPTPYLAVVVQDADHMGPRLGRLPTARDDLRRWHVDVSAALLDAAVAQRVALEDADPGCLGRLVYAGGDDALGFVPVRHAVTAADALNAAFGAVVAGSVDRPGALPGATASTVLVFFHASSSLQSTLTAARELLAEAKGVQRPGFAVAVLRRGGERVRAVRPWPGGWPLPAGTSAPAALGVLVEAMRRGLSGRLAADLERDADQIAGLSRDGRRRELRRLAARHGAARDGVTGAVDALLALSSAETLSPDAAPLTSAARWAAVARFIAGEGR